MNFEDEVTVAQPLDLVWPLLLDVPAVAPCFPGASLAVAGEGAASEYVGSVRIRIGPLGMEYAGTAALAGVDEASRTVVIEASGRDRRGAGLATAVVEAALKDAGEMTVLRVRTDLRLTGRVAQFGSSVIQQVAGGLLREFAVNLAAQLAS